MDFGNPKMLRILTICILFRVLKRLEEEGGGGGGLAYRYRLCDTPNEAKVPSKKIRQKMHIYTTDKQEIWFFFIFAIRITFEQVSKQRLKVKNSIKLLLNAIFWLDF